MSTNPENFTEIGPQTFEKTHFKHATRKFGLHMLRLIVECRFFGGTLFGNGASCWGFHASISYTVLQCRNSEEMTRVVLQIFELLRFKDG